MSAGCSRPTCTSEVKARSLCAKHYREARKAGTLEGLPRCSLEGCEATLYAKGFCEDHYYSWSRYGDPLVRKRRRRGSGTISKRTGQKLVGINGTQVAEHRLIMEDHLGRKLSSDEWVRHRNGDLLDNRVENLVVEQVGQGWTDSNGYRRICVSSETVFEHRYVMESVLGRELLTTESVHHKNSVRSDNRPDNLELWTSSQPAGQRVEDKVAWAKEILALYGDL
jgi:hypothetical protein